MIDPKLNELPVEGQVAADAKRTEKTKTPRAGLSINDTIAGDTTLSTGGRGVDTSGVAAGAGAGAGASFVTPAQPGESPAANVVPAGRGTGMTPRAVANPEQLSESGGPLSGDSLTAASSSGFSTGQSSFESTSGVPNTLQVAERAYEIWCSKGCPQGTAEEDWHQAERELRAQSSGSISKTATI